MDGSVQTEHSRAHFQLATQNARSSSSSNNVPTEVSGVNYAGQMLVGDAVGKSAIKKTIPSQTKPHSAAAIPAPLSVRSPSSSLHLSATESISLPVEQDTSVMMLLQLLQQQQTANEKLRVEMQQQREEQRIAMEQQRLTLEAEAEQLRLQVE